MNVLVTGASRGIGKAIALKFASLKHNVVVVYNKSDYREIDEFRNYLENKYNITCLVVKCDVSLENEVINLFNEIKIKLGYLDCIINNAGICKDEEIDSKTADSFMEVIKVNLLGTFLICKYGIKLMNKGSIINISSNNAFGGFIESVDYDASKAGVIALTHDFAKFLAPNIRVNCICPGWINTDMNKDIFSEFRKQEEEKILLKKFGEVEDIADTVYFLATNKYINNAVVKVDGGYEN